MGDFDGIDSASSGTTRLPKLTAGEYVLEVMNNTIAQTRKFGKAVFREFIIRESVGEGALPAGTQAKAKPLYFTDDAILSRIKEYVTGLTGTKSVDSKLTEAIFSAENPARGKLVRARVYPAEGDNGPYLRYDWSYVAEDDKKKK